MTPLKRITGTVAGKLGRERQGLQAWPKWALAIGGVVGLWVAWELLKLSISLLNLLFVVALMLGIWVGLPTLYFWSWWRLVKQRVKQGVKQEKAIRNSVLAFFLCPIPFSIHIAVLILSPETGNVQRGAMLASATLLQQLLQTRQAGLTRPGPMPLLEIAGIEIPSDLENLGFFFVGSPGSGKTQAIKRLLAILRERSDFRVMVLDRNGELLESFYREGGDLLFNPKDARSLNWNHHDEGMEPETIAAALVPDDSKERFFSEAAKSLLADLYERCRSNQEVWEVISTFSMKEIEDFLSGSVSARYFGGENTGSSVLSTLVNEMRFYRRLVDDDGFSFSRWGREDDPRWLFCTVFEDDAELFKPLYSMAFELMLKGLLSHPDPEGRRMKTAIVVDELGALNQLRSLSRLLSEARKFGGTAILGTQTEAQIDRNYGELDRRVILQGTCTKLILNCRDGKTAEVMADLIGKQERIDITRSDTRQGLIGGSVSKSEQIREVHTVMPGELQSLPPLEGYLMISDGTPAARVKVEAQGYGKGAMRFVAIEKKAVPPID
jgi:Type IV secretion-system coupling protein DNA-binding domain